MKPAELIKKYVELRDTKAAMKAEQEAAMKPYTEALETIEIALLDYLNEAGAENVKTEYGTAFKKQSLTTKMVDRQALVDSCVERNNFDCFTNNLSKEAVKQYIEDFKMAPPGVEVTHFTTVNVRRT